MKQSKGSIAKTGKNNPMFGRKQTKVTIEKRRQTQKNNGTIQKEKILLICQHCKNVFEVSPCEAKTRKYCSHECHYAAGASDATKMNMSKANSGENNGMYGKKQSEEAKEKNKLSSLGKRNGIKIENGDLLMRHGRWLIWINGERMLRSKYVAEKCLDRKINTGKGSGPTGEIIHHINGNKEDDRPENLYVFASNGKHMRWHNSKIKSILISNII